MAGERPIKLDANGNQAEIPAGERIAEDLIPLDSGEHEYTPGLGSGLIDITAPAGYTKIYDQAVGGNPGFKSSTPNTPGRAFVIHSVMVIPVARGSEDDPVVQLEIRDSDDSTVTHVPYTLGVISKRKEISCPVDGKVYIRTDIQARVPWTIDIEEIP